MILDAPPYFGIFALLDNSLCLLQIAERSFRLANLLEEDLVGPDQKLLRVKPYEISTIKLSVP